MKSKFSLLKCQNVNVMCFSVAPFNSMKERDPNGNNENPGKYFTYSQAKFKTLSCPRPWHLCRWESQGGRHRQGHDVELILNQGKYLKPKGNWRRPLYRFLVSALQLLAQAVTNPRPTWPTLVQELISRAWNLLGCPQTWTRLVQSTWRTSTGSRWTSPRSSLPRSPPRKSTRTCIQAVASTPLALLFTIQILKSLRKEPPLETFRVPKPLAKSLSPPLTSRTNSSLPVTILALELTMSLRWPRLKSNSTPRETRAFSFQRSQIAKTWKSRMTNLVQATIPMYLPKLLQEMQAQWILRCRAPNSVWARRLVAKM